MLLAGRGNKAFGEESFAPICSKLEVITCEHYLSMRHMMKKGLSIFMLWCIGYLAFVLLSFILQ